MRRGFLSITSDFGVQTQGVGIMEGAALEIAPNANVIHLMHGLPAFDITAAARTMETVRYLPVGAHVCVCDPGVGTARKAIACEVGRGDFLVGPDNGVLIPATRVLGGLRRIHQITNPQYMRLPVSPLFHGRDIFTPAAAHLVTGVALQDLGPALSANELVLPPYSEATLDGSRINGNVIQINRYGSLHINVLHEMWDRIGISLGATVFLEINGATIAALTVATTFGDVPLGNYVIVKDDYGRVEIAKNQGSFVEDHPALIGQQITLLLPPKD
jgi:S-adenosylmethionine hydrolase